MWVSRTSRGTRGQEGKGTETMGKEGWALKRPYLMVLDDSSLDMAASLYGIPKLAEQMVCHTHKGQRSDVPVVDLEDSLVGRLRLV